MQKNQGSILHIMDNIRRVFQILNEESQRVKRQTGLTGPQIWAIRVIHEHGRINSADIAKHMFLHPATVLGIIDRLEAHGLVARSRSKDDRRIIWVELTQAGKDLVTSVPEVIHGLLSARLMGAPANELASIDEGIDFLVRICGAHEIPPKPMFSMDEK